ncbi:MAG TPA: hypothetical protein VFB58_12100 [Chloroflexota bacterium]|nr:hypothetical protein [Chloroflexota bacterium]
MQWIRRVLLGPPGRYRRSALISLGIAGLGLAELVVLFAILALAFVVQIFVLWGRYGDNPQHGALHFWAAEPPFSSLFTILYYQAGAVIAVGVIRAAVIGVVAMLGTMRWRRA